MGQFAPGLGASGRGCIEGLARGWRLRILSTVRGWAACLQEQRSRMNRPCALTSCVCLRVHGGACGRQSWHLLV